MIIMKEIRKKEFTQEEKAELVDEIVKMILQELKETSEGVKNIDHGTDAGTRYVRQWEAYFGRKATGCANVDCPNHHAYEGLVGGHVKKVGSDDNSWYITPLCHVCNKDENKEEMSVMAKDLAPYEKIKDIEV